MLPDRNVNALTYREKIRDFAQLTRDLSEHLQQSLVPRLEGIKKTVKSRTVGLQEEEVLDVTVRHLVSNVLESEKFAGELADRLDRYAEAMIIESAAILDPTESRSQSS